VSGVIAEALGATVSVIGVSFVVFVFSDRIAHVIRRF
jgi:hypothetical protein